MKDDATPKGLDECTRDELIARIHALRRTKDEIMEERDELRRKYEIVVKGLKVYAKPDEYDHTLSARWTLRQVGELEAE